jgi:nicotinamidase/pyrazinamidase
MVRYEAGTALVVVDMQNDFADPRGSLHVTGAENVVREVNNEVAKALAGGGFLVYTMDWHPESTSHFSKDGGIWPTHCVMNTWGAEFHPAVEVHGPSVKKGSKGEDGYSGFTMRDPLTAQETPTGLATMLSESDVTRIVVVGLALDYCVKATALDGLERFEASIISAATAAVDLQSGDGDRALDELAEAGVEIF